jgi:NAD+ diphosphatase
VKENRFFIFHNDMIIFRKDASLFPAFSESEWVGLKPWAKSIVPISKGHDNQDFAVELMTDWTGSDNFEQVSLRSLVGRIDDNTFNLWGKASQLLYWQKIHRYCGCCGQQTLEDGNEQAKVCPTCSLSYYPRISPCVIVLITRGDEMLLARSARFRKGMFSTLAGFVEPGESVESTLHREITEEVAIRIKNIRYFGSQPWPFPGQLMLGFFAEYDSGEIQIDGVEISDARWYHFRNLPPIPGEGTIAGKMIRFQVDHLTGTEFCTGIYGEKPQ